MWIFIRLGDRLIDIEGDDEQTLKNHITSLIG